ncbi:hypothetical protein [Mucilaginibacter psychrotolerans]|uniref:Uncharacterized protein n=1 Tax=Mucilaginibacter psychrotolerans TaxID=1524096 RepID=A0A4Y8S5V9_9SPHI|nr:hypothetical protein [Mucilaginibacter psychrotolerans]TFF34389.1 hypothetical protein E2R66_22200 [Mucilaginibacter psychrotolerans]
MANSGGGNTTQTNVLVNIGVQGQQAVTQATQQVQNLNSTAQAGSQINMAAPVRTLRQELRNAQNELQRLAASGQQNTQQFTNAARQVAQLRNDIDETNNSVKAFDPDNKFKVFANFASAGAKAIQGYAGAMAFLGVEGEDYAKTLVKLQGLMAFTQAIDSLGDIKDSFKDLGRLLGLTTTQTVAAATATAGQTTAMAAQTTATIAQTTATQGAAVATNALGTAWKLLGIGLLISAVAYLVTNWDELKASVQKLIPALSDTKGGFDKVMQTIYGVGNVIIKVLKAPIDALITQFKVLYKVMAGDFAGAADEIRNGAKKLVDDFDVVGNYQAGVASKLAAQREEHRKDELKKDIENLKNRIEVLKAGGKDVTKLQAQLYKEQLELAKGNEEDLKKLRQEYAVQQASDQKKKDDEAKAKAKQAADAAKEKLKADLAELKKNNEDARKVIADANKSALLLELSNLDVKYKKEFTLLEKRKKDIKDYNSEFKNLTNARKVEETAIIKKYDDEIKAYDEEVNSTYLSSYEKREREINKKADELLKKASTPQQKATIEQDRAFQLNQNSAEGKASDANNAAQLGLVNAENENRPNEKDTPDEARLKIDNLAKAKFDAENAAFELKKTQLAGQQDEIELLTAQHNKTLTDDEEANAKARKEIAEAEKNAKIATYGQIGEALGVASQLAGENTIAGKALAVASTTVSTYLAAQQAYASQLTPGDPTSPFRAALAMGVAIATGLANVKKIVSVKVPGSAAGGGGGSAPITPPVINSTVINRDNNGVNEIRDSIDNNTKKQQDIRAYIVDKDLEKQQSKSSYYNAQSTI